MIDDSLPPFSFPSVARKKVTADFDGGRLTSDGGVMLLSMAERRLGVAERLARCFPDRRDPARIVNAGELLQRLAGAKVQQGCKQKGPRYRGPFCLSRFF